ncbi:hypothetical protein GTV32_09850 [Gordonia sp. SID5947]|uniref:hypothetical protein n=1 Tax=Gordonia sp. SID5947 TaxID=2690315 RepID=UPI001369AB1C|nr:hypothetical protein [Gordonia sp. SID5947]MYR06595.1 hypothetical protein [Gordonia sp. SID5947]
MKTLLDLDSVTTNAQAEGSSSRTASGWVAAAYLRPRRGYLLTYVFIVTTVIMLFTTSGLFTSEVDLANWSIVALAWVTLVFLPLYTFRRPQNVKRLTGIPFDRIRPLGRHIVVTEKGLILDTPHTTQYLPWANVQFVPPAMRSRNQAALTDDILGASTEIIGDGTIVRRRWTWRAVGDWAKHGDGEPAVVIVDVAAFAESFEYSRLLSVLGRYCVAVAPSPDAPMTRSRAETHETQSDVWLAEARLPDRGWHRLQVLRVVVVALSLAATGTWGAVFVWGAEPATTAVMLGVVAGTLVALRPLLFALFRLVGLPVTRTRWVGCHLTVMTTGLLVTTRSWSEFLAWESMRAVVPHPLDPTPARLLGVPRVHTRCVVGDGSVWQHSQPFPLRRIGRQSRTRSKRSTIYIDPTLFVDTQKYSEIGRCMWEYRPDIAAALGFVPPLRQIALGSSDNVEVTFRGAIDPDSSEGRLMSVTVPACGEVRVLVAHSGTTVRVHGAGVPTIQVERIGPIRDDNLPIGTAEPSDLRVMVGETQVVLTYVVREEFSRIPHQFVVVDAFGDVLRLVADDHTRTRQMILYRGARKRPLQLALRRYDDGRIDVMTPRAWTGSRAPTAGEFALAIGLAAAIGTRSVNLNSVPSSVAYHFMDGLAGP